MPTLASGQKKNVDYRSRVRGVPHERIVHARQHPERLEQRSNEMSIVKRVWTGHVPALLALAIHCCLLQIRSAAAAENLVEAAKKEGEVVFYAGMTPSDLEILRARFQEKYPFVGLRVNRVGGGKILTKVGTEVRAGKHFADVIQTNQFDLYTFRKIGLLENYVSPEDSFYSNAVKDRGYWTSYQLLIRVVAYNTKLVPPDRLPKTYQDLLNPKGKIR
jgi:ABC-type glycerol-3-phosphate transport system substrate-binding protein